MRQVAAVSLSQKIALRNSCSAREIEWAEKRKKPTHRGFQKWAPHEGFGACSGIGGACAMGINGEAAPAGPAGLCDLCNMEDIPDLHRHGQGRLAHLLLQLNEPEGIKAMVSDTIATDLRTRMRGPRGPYNTRRAFLPAQKAQRSRWMRS